MRPSERNMQERESTPNECIARKCGTVGTSDTEVRRNRDANRPTGRGSEMVLRCPKRKKTLFVISFFVGGTLHFYWEKICKCLCPYDKSNI